MFVSCPVDLESWACFGCVGIVDLGFDYFVCLEVYDLRLCMVITFLNVALKVLFDFPAVAGFDLAVADVCLKRLYGHKWHVCIQIGWVSCLNLCVVFVSCLLLCLDLFYQILLFMVLILLSCEYLL